ncbi:MAG: hypothetical protein VYC05_05190 [Verrucomicrobiota bacterium]|nr:hypothetical protein [Verrucomicrobiota bacterium]MEE2724758.1 hypothetical protein [Verrucomicrobiota bacterium]
MFFIITAISSFGQGVWIEENFDKDGLKTGKIEVNGNIYEIKLRPNLRGANFEDADISRVIGVFPFITFNDVQPLNDSIVELTRGSYYGKKELQPILEALGQLILQ